jgi:hypothetical protein
MIYRLAFHNSGARLLHSPDLDDMRRAIVEADDDRDRPRSGAPQSCLRPLRDPAAA